MINETLPPHEHHAHCGHFTAKRISWSAIFVGALVGVGLSFLLYIFGIAIGLSAVNASHTSAHVIAIGGMIGVIIGLIASMMTAGYTAGYLGRHYCPHRNLGIVYGFTTWSVAVVLSAVVMTHLGNYTAWYAHTILGPDTVVIQNTSNNTSINQQSESSKDIRKNNLDNNVSVSDVKEASHALAWGAAIMFALFFLGALSSCIGACWAMMCRKED